VLPPPPVLLPPTVIVNGADAVVAPVLSIAVAVKVTVEADPTGKLPTKGMVVAFA
jgi:hypothetical protein